MGCIGNKCPGLEEYHTFESRYCLDQCDHQCVPASVLIHIQNKQRVDVHQGEYVSATALTSSTCPRQFYLERTTPYYVEPPKNWWSIRGTLLHQILQNPDFNAILDDMRSYYLRAISEIKDQTKAEELWSKLLDAAEDLHKLLPKRNHIEDWDAEITYEYNLGIINGKERKLFGTIDVLRKLARQIIDYKTIGDRGMGIIKKGAKEDHIMQFNIYRFLVMRGHPVGMNPADYAPVDIEKITAYYMSMMDIVNTGGLMVQTTDYRVSEPPNDYTSKQILGSVQELVTKRGKRKDSLDPNDKELRTKTKYRLTYQIPEVPLLDLGDVEVFIRTKAQVLFDAFDKMEVPDMVGPEVRAWKCDDYCPDQIRAKCDSINEANGVTRLVNITTEEIAVES
jgi:hypothetical protein